MSAERLFAEVPGVPAKWNLERIGYPEPGEHYLTESGPQIALGMETFEHPVAIVQCITAYTYPNKRKRGSELAGREARFRNVIRTPWTHGTIEEYRKSVPFKWKCKETGRWYRYMQLKVGEE